MNCSNTQKLMLDYVYGELCAKKVIEFEDHIRQCPDCSAALKEIRFTQEAFRNAEVKVPSNEVIDNIMTAAEQAADERFSIPERRRDSGSIRSREFWRAALAGAACLLFALAGLQFFFHPFTETVVREVPVPVAQNISPETNPATPVSFSSVVDVPQDRLKFQQSLLAFDASVEKLNGNPDGVNALFNRAWMLLKSNRHYEAFCLLKLIEHEAPGHKKRPIVTMIIGILYDRAGLPAEALRYYNKTLPEKLSPQDAAYLKRRIDILKK